MVHNEVLRILGQIVERFLPGVEPGLQGQHILERSAAMLADVAERKIAAVHSQHDEGAGDAEDDGRFGGSLSF